jgi:hypothetical protein
MRRNETHLVTLGSNRVDLVDEDDRRRVLLRLLERLPQVRLRLSRHLRHDLGTVDQEEERSRLVRNRTSHERLTRSGRTEHEDTTRRLDTDRLEELRVTERKLDELTDLSKLLAATSDVVVTNVCEVRLLVLALDGLALGVDDGVLSNDTVLGGIRLDNLELNTPRSSLGEESVALADGAVSLEEVGLEEDVEDVTGKTCLERRW